VSPGAIGRRTFAALANPNYRRWYAGQGISLVGTWMQTIAQGWLVYTLTGSGTFVAPASGRGSSAVTGGGTWTTSSGGSGTYTVTGLVSWEFANVQAPTPAFIDNIDHGTRVNGTAVLTIAFSDGTQGVLTVGCHGPGAPPGIFEGIATTKAYTTYYTVEAPVGGVDANRTNFHLR
jgi:hypothetical protein